MKRLQPSLKEDTIEEYGNPQPPQCLDKRLLKSGIRVVEETNMDSEYGSHATDKQTDARGAVNGLVGGLMTWVTGWLLGWLLVAFVFTH
jgi:hypothetical protein